MISPSPYLGVVIKDINGEALQVGDEIIDDNYKRKKVVSVEWTGREYGKMRPGKGMAKITFDDGSEHTYCPGEDVTVEKIKE